MILRIAVKIQTQEVGMPFPLVQQGHHPLTGQRAAQPISGYWPTIEPNAG